MDQEREPAVDGDVRVHRALSSPVRRRLLEFVRGTPDVDAAWLAERLGLHVNTVRAHLAVLEDAGLAVSAAEARDRPGRPKLLYRAADGTGDLPAGPDDGGYRLLAEMLAGQLSSVEADAAESAERTGSAWGRHLVDGPAPLRTMSPATAVERLVALLGSVGFEPELDGTDASRPRVLLHRCPFLEVAKEHPDVVCSIHLGLMRGVLDELGVDVEARELIPWAQPDLCVARLGVPG